MHLVEHRTFYRSVVAKAHGDPDPPRVEPWSLVTAKGDWERLAVVTFSHYRPID